MEEDTILYANKPCAKALRKMKTKRGNQLHPGPYCSFYELPLAKARKKGLGKQSPTVAPTSGIYTPR